MNSPKEDGLQSHYDVVLYGTGFIPSILASALARAGKSVLHCDDASYYGQMDSVLTLPYLRQNESENSSELWKKEEEDSNTIDDDDEYRIHTIRPTLHSTDTLDEFPMTPGTKVTTPYGQGTVLSKSPSSPSSLQVSLSNWKLADGKTSPTLYVGQEDMNTIQPSLQLKTQKILHEQSRSFALDMTPTLVFGAGAAVQGFLTSGVSDYCEFQTVPALLFGEKLQEVPCSKSKVFSTKLLGPLEKRQLMKLLQLVMDYATAVRAAEEEAAEALKQQRQQANEEVIDSTISSSESKPTTTFNQEEVVQSVNERQLNQGRSLSRPQNKKVVDELESLQQLLSDDNNDITFASWCRDVRKLSPHLSHLVQHALALSTSSEMSLQEGLTRLAHHVQGLGQFGTTAFLCPLYGSGEFAQAFCRSAAVHGATYLLRRPLERVCVNEEKKVTSVVLGSSCEEDQDLGSLTNDHEPQTILCDHIILPCGSLRQKPKKWLLRRISILSSQLLSEADHQRHVVILPPTEQHPFATHGLILDYSVRVAPPNCTVLHLTTTIESPHEPQEVLQGAVQDLLKSCSNNNNEEVQELYHVCYSYPLFDKEENDSIHNLHTIPSVGQTLCADDSFVIAKEIFSKICPTVEFLQRSQAMEETIAQNQFATEPEDEERDVLDQAYAAQFKNENDNNQNGKVKGQDNDEPSDSKMTEDEDATSSPTTANDDASAAAGAAITADKSESHSN